MNEKPIPFNAEMARATFDDNKTQTRRVVRPYPRIEGNFLIWDGPRPKATRNSLSCSVFPPDENHLAQVIVPYSPYGKPGDRLWVQEEFAFRCADPKEDPEYGVMYKANGGCIMEPQWKPPKCMPRWASRMTLEISAVRVERLQEIGPYSIEAEGLTSEERNPIFRAADLRNQFIDLWDSFAKPGEKWADNRLVWVYTFSPVKDGQGEKTK